MRKAPGLCNLRQRTSICISSSRITAPISQALFRSQLAPNTSLSTQRNRGFTTGASTPKMAPHEAAENAIINTSVPVYPALTPEKERVLILGSGWAGYILSRQLSTKKYSTTIVSPRSYFLFTPLLNDATLHALEFSSVTESLRERDSKVGYVQAWAKSVDWKNKVVRCEANVIGNDVAEADGPQEHSHAEAVKNSNAAGTRAYSTTTTPNAFEIPYDKLIVSVGTEPQTFGTKGIKENALFLRNISDARKVRKRVLECFELASLPTATEEIQKCLLHFAIVGGGPTGTEFAGDLVDFLHEDLCRIYPGLEDKVQVTIYDVAPKVLGSFDASLAQYAMETMKKAGIDIRTSHHIEELRWGLPNQAPPDSPHPRGCLTLKTKEQGDVGVGMCLWSTGNAVTSFVTEAMDSAGAIEVSDLLLKETDSAPSLRNDTWKFKKDPKSGSLLVDDQLRPKLVLERELRKQGHKKAKKEKEDSDTPTDENFTEAVLPDIFALGDTAMIESGSPPVTAQAATQEAKWLATQLNKGTLHTTTTNTNTNAPTPPPTEPRFTFRDMGVLTYLGNEQGLMQAPNAISSSEDSSDSTTSPVADMAKKAIPVGIKGRTAWLVWKAAYLSMTLSWRNRMMILVNWGSKAVFGRSVGRF